MRIETSRFGAVEADESRVIRMKGCILGFDHLQYYTILLQDQENPFRWLQSLEDGVVAFVVIDPSVIRQDYHPVISSADRTFLEISREEEISLLSIVTIRHRPFCVTANLRAPIAINGEKRLGSQIILQDADYPIRYDISSVGNGKEDVNTVKIASL